MFSLSDEYREFASDQGIDWSPLDNATCFITGATGLVGSCLTRALLERSKSRGNSIKILAPVRNLEKARSLFSEYGDDACLSFIEIEDLVDLADEPIEFDYLVHAACPTSSSQFVERPAETLRAIVNGTQAVLDLAVKAGVKSALYVSSMEVYGGGHSRAGVDSKLGVEDVGYLDPLRSRSCYPEGKRMAECLSFSYFSEFGLPVKIARLSQTFGPGVRHDDRRVYMQFARSALEGGDIVLNTPGTSTRMYCYTTDVVAAMLTILLKGENGKAYNVANEETYISVRDMADFVLSNFSTNQARVVLDIDPDAPYPPEHHLPLDTSSLQDLGWSPKYGLYEMYSNLIAYIK